MMKRALVLSLSLLLSSVAALQPTTIETLPKKSSYEGAHFYLASSPYKSFASIIPGVRWRKGRYGLDGNLLFAPMSSWQRVAVAGLVYLTPNADKGWQHYLLAGPKLWVQADSWVTDYAIYTAYGFEKRIGSGQYAFASLGVNLTAKGKVKHNLPIITVGYAF